MSAFKIVPQLQSFDKFEQFAGVFSVDENDLIITDRCIYNPFFEGKGYKCSFIIQDDFGGGEPNDEKVNAIRIKASEYKYNRVIAVGGGSVIDIGKLLSTSGWTECLPLFRKEIAPIRDKKLVIIPTTCGTGSEVTNISVVAFKSLGTKIGLAADELYADDAVLVSEFLTGLPAKVFMHSSIDALIHAVESYLSPKANPTTKLFSAKAINTITDGYQALAEKGMDYRRELLGDFLLASCYAGIAFSNAGCGLVHAMSYPIGGEYHLPHGEANFEVFLSAMKFYEKKAPDGRFAELTALMGSVDSVNELISALVQRRPMSSFGMTEEIAKDFAADVIKNQQRLLANCYVPATVEDMVEIYKQIL